MQHKLHFRVFLRFPSLVSFVVRVYLYGDVKTRENDNVMLSRANILWRCKGKDTKSSKVEDYVMTSFKKKEKYT